MIWLSLLGLAIIPTGLAAQVLPVMAFHGVQPEYTNKDSFLRLKEAGFNINFTVYQTNAQAQKALDCAELTGIKILLYTPELIHNTGSTVLRFRNHPALFGYYVGDEPSSAEFRDVAAKMREIKKYDRNHPTYVNLFPNYADMSQLKETSYSNYLHRFTQEVGGDFLSFDNYPLMNNRIHGDWFANLEMIRSAALSAKKPFWGFANATVFGPYKQPTLAGLRLQMYTNLLYGAQGLQYFTYWTLDDEYWRKHKFGHAIVDSKGKPTVTYATVKKTNADIQKYAHVFLEATVHSVYHTSFRQPNGTKKLMGNPPGFHYFRIDSPALVSSITKGPKKYTIVLNTDIAQSHPIFVEGKLGSKYLDAQGLEVSLGRSRRSFMIPPGGIQIFSY